MQSRDRGWIILALFFCSGATALVYEVIWSKFLSEMFGSTIYAQTVVLAVFMAGLALGNRIFGRMADRLKRPVRTYGLLEGAIGIYALLFPLIERATDHLFIALGTPIAERPGWLLALKGLLSVVLLLGPTVLMGGTLPLLAAWLQRSTPDAGRRSARFYSVNSLGAVTGAGLAGFWLVQHFGLIVTLQVTALANLLIGVIAIFLSRHSPTTPDVVTQAKEAESSEAILSKPESLWAASVIVALTGGVSMGLELLASRSMALMFGSSLQSFAVVLMAFILGIGLGSAAVASLRLSNRSTRLLLVLLLCSAAGWIVLLVFNIESWVDFYRLTRIGLARNNIGYVYHLLLTSGISLFVLGVPAGCIGAVLPLMIRSLSSEQVHLGAVVGRLLTWNTLGAVAGTLFTGFVLMPTVGLRNAFGILATVLTLVALILAWQRWSRTGLVVSLIAIVFSVSLFFGGDTWRQVMSSGIFRIREAKFIPNLMRIRKEQAKLLFYKDAPDATVSVELGGGIITSQSIGLRINGKADAGTDIDLCNQLLLAHLPLLAKPDAKDVFVLGFGSGMTAGAALAFPVNQVVVAENCEPVIEAAKFFSDWNRDVLHNPRAHLRREDARTVLKLSPQLYDVIITEPSNPWTVGVGSVFNQNFYKLAASRLKPNGIIAQWFHLYETEDRIVELVLRTFNSVFPNVEIWDTGSGDMVILGSLQPWKTGPEVFRKGFAIERVRTDMHMVDINSPEGLWARQLASQQTGFAIAGEGPIQTDLFPILEYDAPLAFYTGDRSRILDQYDERTRQQLFAPAQKNAVLKSLSISEIQLILSAFSTINGELYGSVFGNPATANVPCVFKTPNPPPAPASDGSILSYAAQAFASGNLNQAEQISTMAVQQNPTSEQARYVARIIARAKQENQSGQKGVATWSPTRVDSN